MSKSKLSAVLVLSMIILVPIGAFAHTVETANGCTVNHYDNLGYCLPWYPYDCPDPDSEFESDYGFSAYDRVYSGTYNFNCHGRTFDNRGCWIDYADQYINCDGPFCPYNPGYGDAIIWFNGSGTTTHSATIISNWNGTSTTIKSKYGKQGEYWHSLANCIYAYGSNWTVTRFSAGTTIYNTTQENFMINKKNNIEKLLEDRKKMPWYKDILESEEIFETKGKKIIERITSLSNENRSNYEKSSSVDEKIETLFRDFVNNEHYKWLGIFNSPEFSTDYIQGIEAGNLLVELCMEQPEFKEIISEKFTGLLGQKNLGNNSDHIKGAAIFFLGKILDREQQLELMNYIKKLNLSPPQDRITNVPTYFDYYLKLFSESMVDRENKGEKEKNRILR